MKYTPPLSDSVQPPESYRLPDYASLDEDAHPQDEAFVEYVAEMRETWESVLPQPRES